MASRAPSELSSALSSAPPTPTTASREPLPVPTTLATHTRGPRLLRSGSRSSRGSRASSAAGSRSSSRSRHSDARVEPILGASDGLSRLEEPIEPSGSGPVVAGPSTAQSYAAENRGQTRPSRKRRRAYSIQDEIGIKREASDGRDDLFIESSDVPTSGPSKRAPPGRRGNKRGKVQTPSTRVGPSSSASTSTGISTSEPDFEILRLPDEIMAEGSTTVLAIESSSSLSTSATMPAASPAPAITSESLVEYSCPICFSPPTNATMTLCGHVCCGECLFTAVRSALQRAPAGMPLREPNVARCPVCRAVLKGWDGRGGGVIGLRPRTIISL